MRILILLVCALAACGAQGDLGVACETDDDCIEGLTCQGLAEHHADGSCSATLKACTTACADNADCEALTTGAMCFEGCEADSAVCGLTG